MDYSELWKEENESVRERYDLVTERISQIMTEESVTKPYRDYFQRTAAFIMMIDSLYGMISDGSYKRMDLERVQKINDDLYEDILPGNYEISYADPAYAATMLSDGIGPLLSFLYTEIRSEIAFAFECRLSMMTILDELFVEIYDIFEDDGPDEEEVRSALYYFVSDYTDMTLEYRVRELTDPTLTFAKDIIMNEDLGDIRYLYDYGEYISDEEIKLSRFMASLPEETINKMADTYTEGYRRGFEVTGRDITKKKTVAILYELGFERMIRRSIENFRKLGLEPVIFRAPVLSSDRNPNQKRGFHGTSPNRQFEYDHRYDNAIYLDKAYTDRKLSILKLSYEKYKAEAAAYGGPAWVDTFGVPPFSPVNKPSCLSLSRKQEKLVNAYSAESSRVVNEYEPGDETSFTIIAFPKPSIGPDFADIFEETIRINTLDYELYRGIQQSIVDRLDKASMVVVKGKGGNHTDMNVMLHTLEDPDHMTNFENCVADVNIPLGEVFTSPVLKGTHGRLEVSAVYIDDILFKDLWIEFEDGMSIDYGCGNFEDQEQGRALVKQVILRNHDTLPIGECAIGTNTTAYAVAQKYDIIDKLPILIVEKMGPHFALGDTCYSWAEDTAVYNPDGKEIIARDNEISILRKEDISEAYFNCHNDITIPYREVGEIYGVTKDGVKLPVIDGGRFVVPGTERLNEELNEGM